MTEFLGYEHGDLLQWRDNVDDLALLIICCDEYLIFNLTGRYKNIFSWSSLKNLRLLGWKAVSRVQK